MQGRRGQAHPGCAQRGQTQPQNRNMVFTLKTLSEALPNAICYAGGCPGEGKGLLGLVAAAPRRDGGLGSSASTAQHTSVPGSGVWRVASVRLRFHSLIPGTRAACKEFNASLSHPKALQVRTLAAPGRLRPCPSRTQPESFSPTTPWFPIRSGRLSRLPGCAPCPAAWAGWRQGVGSAEGATPLGDTGVVTGQHNQSPTKP